MKQLINYTYLHIHIYILKSKAPQNFRAHLFVHYSLLRYIGSIIS